MPGSLTPWKRFLKERELLPSAFEEQNSSGRGQHAEYSKTEVGKVPLERCGQILGHSANALVEVVKCKRITLARKTIRCGRRMRREDAAKEVEHLQRLNHAHIVRVVGTYVFEHSRNLQILIYPVADCDLETYMETDFDRDVLVRFFGCLAHTIEYLHKKLIKHIDIKPKNILVRYRYGSYEQAPKIYLADFGIARSYESALDAETCSPTAYTRTYAAPEVVAQETRGFKADIFSLGCVFAEMLCALAYRSDELIGILQENIEDKSFQANIETVQYLVNSLRDQDLIHLGADLAIFNCHRMLHRDPDMRPPANIVLHYLPHHQCCIAMSDRLEVSSDYQ
ncbi:hypothetical protein MPH_02312 [Macrophomina phaseolina MS6]|uniref:Protein kinase domain-containing protein n=1 Tax=Macrophomina phaseolina (strain MS6) TaxID=1126212 RepID=K2RCY3_MACPH|nr:hypothetical protein MPH_02312 [Macrophomina phaseolina MS6]